VSRPPYVFVPIPKCASTWFKHAFGKNRGNFETNGGFVIPDSTWVVVLRDPVDRWISGLAQYHHGHTLDWYLHYRNLGWNRVFEQVVFDNHTEPQSSFISNINMSNTVWFQFGSTLSQDFGHWCQDKFVPEPNLIEDDQTNSMVSMPALQPGRTLSGQQMLTEIREVVQNNPGYQQLLREFYREDCKLYDSVPFYRAG
jgi:hypothetical protein